MAVELIELHPDSPNDQAVQRAARALADGALVAFPTETVYGLAANAANADSVNRLREIKGRADRQPFTVHIGSRADCEAFAPNPSAVARRLMKKGWPGPLTLVFPVEDPSQAPVHARLNPVGVEAIYSAKTVGIRFPDHRVAQDFLTAAGAPIIASSANLGGDAPPTDGAAIQRTLGDRIDLILDAGPTRYRKSSTIVALNGTSFRLLRSGVLDERTIRRLATVTILFVCTGNTCRSPMAEGIFRQMVAQKLGARWRISPNAASRSNPRAPSGPAGCRPRGRPSMSAANGGSTCRNTARAV
jgi:tRNA threonylcarbamoyl adenosine modification protein (Sua5/YciO/YrdC/YwlC family)